MVSQENSSESIGASLKIQEEAFRLMLERILASSSIFAASLLSMLLIPIFPATVAVFLAICFGALTYKSPVPAILLMFLCTIWGYLYQLGMPVTVTIAIFALLFVISIRATQPGFILGIACGTAAAVLLSTGLYFLAIPLMVAVPLLRARGRNIGSTSTILVFIALSLPLLVVNAPGSTEPSVGSLPILFGQCNFIHKPPLDFIDFNVIFSRINESMPWTTQAINQYLARLSSYFPTFQVDSKFGLLVVLLAVYLGVAIAVAFGILALFRWLRRNEENRLFIWISPIAAILGAEILFLIVFNAMAGPFQYQTSLSVSLIGGFIICAVLLGGLGSYIEIWLLQRDTLATLRQKYVALLPEISEQAEMLSQACQRTRTMCPNLDIVSEELTAKQVQQDLSLTASDPEHVSFASLQEKVSLLQKDKINIEQSLSELLSKLRVYCADYSAKYRSLIESLAGFGYKLGEILPERSVDELNNYDHPQLLVEVSKLNGRYQGAAESAIQQAQEIQKMILTELDPDLRTTGIIISSNYIQQKNFPEALETLHEFYSSMNKTIFSSTRILDEKYAPLMQNYREALKEAVIPALDKIGDTAGVSQYSIAISNLDELTWIPENDLKMIDLVNWIGKTRNLAERVITSLDDLLRRINDIERNIEKKAPLGYNWGKNTNTQSEIDQLINTCRQTAGWSDLQTRILKIETAVKLIRSGASLITQYSNIREFLINYVNIEFLIQQIFEKRDEISEIEIPVKKIYAQQYLRLFVENHPSQVFVEGGTGKLIKRKLS